MQRFNFTVKYKVYNSLKRKTVTQNGRKKANHNVFILLEATYFMH